MLGVKTKKEELRMKHLKLISGFVFILAIVGIIVGCANQSQAATDSYVTMDINPSIELIVSKSEKVTYANALNEDGEVLLAAIELEGMDLDAAIDLVIQTAIELGYIEADADVETIVQISSTSQDEAQGEQIKERVKAHINFAFEKRAMVGRGQDKEFNSETKAEADAYGVTPGFLFLAKAAVYADDTLTLEAALELEVSALQQIIKETRQEMRDLRVALKDEFIAAREALREEFLVAKAELEAQIEAAESDEDREALVAELDALIEAHVTAMAELRAEFLVESEALRLEYLAQVQVRKQLHMQRALEFMQRVEERKSSITERIRDFQDRP